MRSRIHKRLELRIFIIEINYKTLYRLSLFKRKNIPFSRNHRGTLFMKIPHLWNLNIYDDHDGHDFLYA